MKNKTSEIVLKVELNQESIPEQITWVSQDGGAPEAECKAFMLSIFDRDSRETLKIDLWTQDMQIQEMDRFFYHTLRSMASSYRRATSNTELSGEMDQFAEHFGKRIGFLAE